MEFEPLRFLAERPDGGLRLRWVFEFTDHREPRVGGWHPPARFEDSSAAVDKRNLLWAKIEGKDFITRQVKVYAECPGPEFVEFKDLAVLFFREGKEINFVYGKELIAEGYKITVLCDGSTKFVKRGSAADSAAG